MIVRHVSHRCPKMREHSTYRDGKPMLPVPCEECYSIEAFSRSIPYEPDSRTENVSYPESDVVEPSERAVRGEP